MARKCVISGVSRQSGHRVSHAKNRTKHVFKANIQSKKLFLPELGRSVRLKVSTRMIRTIDKLGFYGALKKHNLTLEDVLAR
jgi:large subunit ribosomal protein L28